MCGIVGAISQAKVTDILLEGLQALEYRGYDSAGIAGIANNQIQTIKSLGKISNLEHKLDSTPLDINIGIAHTRWATHGEPSISNCHPHISHDKIAIVHNGTIDNYQQLRDKLEQHSIPITSETDSELIAHLIYLEQQQGIDLAQAIKNTVVQLAGSYGLLIMDKEQPDRLIAVRHNSPMVLGLNENANYIASDPIALLNQTNNFIYLEQDDIAIISTTYYKIFNAGTEVTREIHHFKHTQAIHSKTNFEHYMLKEIHQQPEVISKAIEQHKQHNFLDSNILAQLASIEIISCGSSYNAGYVAYYWIKSILHIPCMLDFASEYKYLDQTPAPNCLLVLISQSGETADTLSALRKSKDMGYSASLAICNNKHSSLAREADAVIITPAGTEISVAATKSFTSQLIALLQLVTDIALAKKINHQYLTAANNNIAHLPNILTNYLELATQIKQQIVPLFAHTDKCIFFARGQLYPIMLEAALKLKEIAYIHAQTYPGGELKHGPLALIEQDLIVVAMITSDDIAEKFYANLESVVARGAKLILFADEQLQVPAKLRATVIQLPHIEQSLLVPIAYTLVMQLLAYYIATDRGTDVDKPRNLAKSVTVE